MKKSYTAFSLIELLTVIGILAILSVGAVPAYKDYILRAKIASAWSLIDKMKIEIQDYFLSEGEFPDASDLDYPATGTSLDNPADYFEYAQDIIIASHCTGARGEISIQFNEVAASLPGALHLVLLYEVVDGKLTTTCGVHSNSSQSAEETIRYVPKECQARLTPDGNIPQTCS